jgi:two-component system, response regulator YesN
MYKVVIIDDEQVVINGVSKSIDWKEIDLELVGSALDGDEGLELIYKTMPDIIITDIKMPTMSGIEMCKVLRNSNLFPEIILISAYDDHKYAREAINIGAFDYILKPFKPSDLTSVLKNCINKLNSNSIYKKSFEHNNKQNLLKSILTNKIDLNRDNKLAAQINSIYDLPLPSFFAVTTVQLDLHTYKESDISNKEIISFIRLFYISRQSAQVKSIVIDIERKNRIVVFYSFSTTSNISSVLKTDTTALQLKITELFSECPFIGISDYSDSVSDISSLYIESIKAVHLCHSSQKTSIVFYKDINKYKQDFNFIEFCNDLKFSLDNHDIERYKSIISNMFLSHTAKEGDVFNELKLICIKVCHFFELYAIEDLDKEKLEIINNISKNILKTPHFIEIYQATNSLSQLVGRKKNIGEIDKAIKKSLNYIDSNLAEPITLEHVASQVHLSNSFFSVKFSSVVGIPFSKYLANKRIEKAKALFQQNNNLKVYEVGAKVGYNDARYFGTLFKKIVGVTPHQYSINL